MKNQMIETEINYDYINALVEIEQKKAEYEMGSTKELVTILAAAIMNNPNFGMLIVTTLAFIADEQTKFPDINPN